MSKLIAILAVFTISASALADNYVRPHIKSDGTYVEGHYKSAPNGTPYDNYSTKGNTNPYTGQRGNEYPDRQTRQAEPRTYRSDHYNTDSRSRRHR